MSSLLRVYIRSLLKESQLPPGSYEDVYSALDRASESIQNWARRGGGDEDLELIVLDDPLVMWALENSGGGTLEWLWQDAKMLKWAWTGPDRDFIEAQTGKDMRGHKISTYRDAVDKVFRDLSYCVSRNRPLEKKAKSSEDVSRGIASTQSAIIAQQRAKESEEEEDRAARSREAARRFAMMNIGKK